VVLRGAVILAQGAMAARRSHSPGACGTSLATFSAWCFTPASLSLPRCLAVARIFAPLSGAPHANPQIEPVRRCLGGPRLG